ncbi:MAG: hypothetical protein AAGK21_06345 [Bacteroidota bacterium]
MTRLLALTLFVAFAGCGDDADTPSAGDASAGGNATAAGGSDSSACDLLTEEIALATLGAPTEQVLRMPARPADEERFPEAAEFNRANDERMRAEGTDCWYSVPADFRPSYDLMQVYLTTNRPAFDREGSAQVLRGTWVDLSGIGDEAYRMDRGGDRDPSTIIDFRVGETWYRLGTLSDTGAAPDVVGAAAEEAAETVAAQAG